MTKLTKANRARLEKLAAYLEGLPEDYSHFDMADYLYAVEESSLLEYAKHNGGVASCGTAACAVGHGPAAGILFPPRYLKDRWGNPRVVWDRYSTLFVGNLGDVKGHARYRWCFGGEWAGKDNSHFGAAARIRYLLDHGAPPSGCVGREILALYAPYRIDAKAPVNA